MRISPLLKQEVINAINGTSRPERVPSTFTIWPPPAYKDVRFLRAINALRKYQSDINVYYTWSYGKTMLRGNNALIFDKAKDSGAKDASIEVTDFSQLDDFLNNRFNDPYKVVFQPALKTNRYRLGVFWNCLFENLWLIRGMENALMDMYIYPEEVHKIFRKITDFYKVLIIRAKKEANCDGFFVSDDLGHQNNTFFSEEVFRELFYPYYKELIDLAHENGMHFWLHTCGNITNFLPIFIELGLDVIHPIQKYTMDEFEIFNKYKDQICFLYGFDVQQIIPHGTVEDVKQEVHKAFDLFSQANGRFIFAPGNGITPNCPIESFQALLKEAKIYNPYNK